MNKNKSIDLVKDKRLIVLIILIIWIPYFYNCWAYSIWDSNEAYYVEGPKEMLNKAEYLTPMFNHTYRFEKPILSYWVVILFHKLCGSFLLSERLALALFALGSILLTYYIAKEILKSIANNYNDEFSLLAALIFATSFKFYTLAHRSIIDILLTFWILLALYFYLRFYNSDSKRYVFLYYASLAMGMGTLTKGLLGIIVPCGIIFIYLLLQKDFSLLKTKQFYIAVFIYLLIASPWYIYMGLVHGSKYLSFFLIGNHINLFLKGEYSLARPIWYYLPNIIGGFAPWSLFLPFMIYCLYVYHREGKGITNVNFLYAWIGFILVFFSLSKGKQEEYILQIYPAFSILLSLCLSYAVKHIPSVNMKKWVRLTVFLVSFVFLLASFSLHLLNRTIFTSYGELEAIPIFFIFLVIILICKYTASSIKAAAVFSIIITYLFYFMLITFYLPLYEKEYKFVKYFAQYYKNNKRADEDIGYYRIGIPSLVYYTNEKVYIFMSIEEIKKVAEKRRLYLAVDARGYDAYDYLQNNFTVLMKKKQFPTTLKSFIKITQGLGAEEVYLLKNNL